MPRLVTSLALGAVAFAAASTPAAAASAPAVGASAVLLPSVGAPRPILDAAVSPRGAVWAADAARFPAARGRVRVAEHPAPGASPAAGSLPVPEGYTVGMLRLEATSASTTVIWSAFHGTRSILQSAVCVRPSACSRPQTVWRGRLGRGRFPPVAVTIVSGRVLALWDGAAGGHHRLQWALQHRGGRFGAVHTLAEGGIPLLASRAGGAYAAWSNNGGEGTPGRVRFATWTTRAGFSQPVTVADPAGLSALTAVGQRGVALAYLATSDTDPVDGRPMIARRNTPGGRFMSTPIATAPADHLALAGDSAGRLAAAFTTPAAAPAQPATLQATAAPPGDDFPKPFTLDTATAPNGSPITLSAPAVALNDSGTATYAWTRGTAALGTVVAVTVPPTGAPVRTALGDTPLPYLAPIVRSSRGNTAVIWISANGVQEATPQ